MAFDEKHDAGSLLPSLDDGSRSAKGSTDVDTTSNSSRQNNEKLPPIDKNQLVTGNNKTHEEKSRISSSDSTNMENRNSSEHSKRNENSSNKISSSLGTSSNSDNDADNQTNPKEDSQKSELERLNAKYKKPKEALYARKQTEDNRTVHGKELKEPEEDEIELHESLNEKTKRGPFGKNAGSKFSFADKELDELVAKLEKVVNRNLRALQGMKPDDADDEEDELDQKTIDRFIYGDRGKEIDDFLNS